MLSSVVRGHGGGKGGGKERRGERKMWRGWVGDVRVVMET